jgi:hypothetical protein
MAVVARQVVTDSAGMSRGVTRHAEIAAPLR